MHENKYTSMGNDGRCSCGSLLGGRLLHGRVENVPLDAVLCYDANANHSAGAAIVVHRVQDGCKKYRTQFVKIENTNLLMRNLN